MCSSDLPRAVCDFPGCDRTDMKGRGLCNRCYARLRYQGNLPEAETDLERFFYYVRILPGFHCWQWIGSLTEDGYGKFWADNHTVPAHRWIFQQMVSPDIDGLDVDHSCFNRWCVNFSLCLQAVPPRDNWLTSLSPARVNQLKTHCDNGHEFTIANIYWYRSYGNWARGCRECRTSYRKGVVGNGRGTHAFDGSLAGQR